MSYVLNAWYVAGWSDEVGESYFARTFLDVPVVLFRRHGVLHALHDMCPHRFAPLSMGQIVDDKIRCPYHGLEFDMDGNCVGSCTNMAAPRAAKIRVFPVTEKNGLIWLWMGDVALADTDAVPVVAFHEDPGIRYVKGYTHAQANYLLLSDNLMDLTHTAMLHPSFGGMNYLPKFKCWEEDGDVIAEYLIESMPSFMDPTGQERLREIDTMRWIAPSVHILDSHITLDDGKGPPMWIPASHILTPETGQTTHYFWSTGTPADSPTPDEEMHAALSFAFDQEDKPMVEAVQRRMGRNDLWDMNPILLATDAAGIRMRRRLSALIDAERSGTPDFRASVGVKITPHRASR